MLRKSESATRGEMKTAERDSAAWARVRSRGRRGTEEGAKARGKEGGGSGGERRPCPPSGGASKGNFTKADPLVMNVI